MYLHNGTPVRKSNLLTSITISLHCTHLAALLVRLLAEAIATVYADGADGGITREVTPTAAAHIADHRAGLQVAQKLRDSGTYRTRRFLAVLVDIVHIGTFQCCRTAAGITRCGCSCSFSCSTCCYCRCCCFCCCGCCCT